MGRRKEIKAYKVKQDTREVIAYTKSLTSKDKEEIKTYNDNGYKIIMLDREKPSSKANQRIGKEEMKTYLKGKIDNKIYNDLLQHLKSNENFFTTRKWLKQELMKYAKKNNKKFIPANTIIQIEMQNEATITRANIQEYKDQNLIVADVDQEEELSENK